MPLQTEIQKKPHAALLTETDRELARWGGFSALSGVVMFIGTVGVVGGLNLPDASDVATLTNFNKLRSGRIAEHLLYLGALILFALHIVVLNRLLQTIQPVASLFATTIATMGLAIMAASSLLHVSTSPLHDLYTAADAGTNEQQAIEYAWHAAQSIFDTMLATGVLLVPIGIGLFGLAMLKTTQFGVVTGVITLILGIAGTVGATIAIVEPGSLFSAVSVLAIVLFHLFAGWRTSKLGKS